MDITLTHYLIVCPLVFLAGYIDAVAGGGGLVSLPAYLISGLPAHYAIATNKLSSAMGTTLTTVRYARDGFIPWKQAVFCVIFALIGSACGADLALMLDADVFKIIMLFILPVTAIYVFKSKALVTEKPPLSFMKTTVSELCYRPCHRRIRRVLRPGHWNISHSPADRCGAYAAHECKRCHQGD